MAADLCRVGEVVKEGAGTKQGEKVQTRLVNNKEI
jgi:hypothetical protein